MSDHVWIVYDNYYDGLDHHQSTFGVFATEQDAVNAASANLLMNRLTPDDSGNMLVFTDGDDGTEEFYITKMVVCRRDVKAGVPPPDLSLFPSDKDREYVKRVDRSDGRGFSSSKPRSTAVMLVKAGKLEEQVQLRLYHHAKVSEYSRLEHVVANHRDRVGEWMNMIEEYSTPSLMIHITHHEATGNLLVARGWRVVPPGSLPGASRVTYNGRELMYGLHDGMYTFKGFDQAWQEGEVCYVKGDL